MDDAFVRRRLGGLRKGYEVGLELYKGLVVKLWSGEVGSVIRMLENKASQIGKPSTEAVPGNPRKIVSLTLDYVKRNAHRMDYPAYWKAGLPISSAPVESLVKQFNQRVKGTAGSSAPEQGGILERGRTGQEILGGAKVCGESRWPEAKLPEPRGMTFQLRSCTLTTVNCSFCFSEEW